MRTNRTLLALLIAVLASPLLPAADDVPREILRKAGQVKPTPQQAAWQELQYTCFAHFGVNTFTDREWGEGKEDPAIFNPTAFDARQWAAACKAAGMKLLILTCKHHDGFCLWPSKYTDHSVASSPWKQGKGDIVKEVADACREHGLKFGVYLSPWDRHEKTYGSDAYNAYYKNQLRELLTQYGPIAEVWWDGACGEGPNGKRQVYDWDGYIQVVRELQPGAVIFGMGPDVRWVGNESGLARESEWSVLPKRGPGDQTEKDLGHRKYLVGAKEFVWYPAECDVSIRPGWFYHAKEDDKVKSLRHMLDIYYHSVGRNSVLLVNIPPDRRGLFHENDVARLKELRAVLDETFKTNLAAGKPAKASNTRGNHAAGAITDGDPNTYWTTEDGVYEATIEIDLGEPKTFDRAMLQEQFTEGQRIERFALDRWDGQEWKPIAEATTVGSKRLLRFPEATASKVRIRVFDSRDCPTLREFGLYKASSRETFVSLFDGKSFEGWEGNLDVFRIEDGAIVGGTLKEKIPRNEFLCTKKQYGDFELRLKFKVLGDKANAGVQIRSQRIPNHHEVIGYQADLGDGWWGCLYDESRRNKILAGPPAAERGKPVKPGEWNEYVIRCEGPRIQLWINGQQTVDYTEPDAAIPQTGLIAVQIHGGPPSEAWYKDIEIQELGKQ